MDFLVRKYQTPLFEIKFNILSYRNEYFTIVHFTQVTYSYESCLRYLTVLNFIKLQFLCKMMNNDLLRSFNLFYAFIN